MILAALKAIIRKYLYRREEIVATSNFEFFYGEFRLSYSPP